MSTHWKKLTNPDYLGAYDFQQGEERIVTIKMVKREHVTGSGGKKEECTVAHFEEKYKPMILNSTNCKAISKLFESPYIEDWTGKSVKIVVSKVNAFGDVVDALRIKSEKITKTKPRLELNTKNFENCKTALKSGGATMEAIKAKYDVSTEVEAQLHA